MEAGIHELTAGYALDALDRQERDSFEAHLAGCDRCQEELASFWEVTAALAVAATGPAPSAGLRERIFADARAEKQTVVPLEPRRRRLAPALGAATAIAAAVAIGLGVYSLSLDGRLDDTKAALARQQRAAEVLADSSAQTVALRSGSGKLVVTKDGRAVLVLVDVDPAPRGKSYELWIVKDGKPAPAGLFDGTEGTDVVPLDGRVGPGSVVAVTLEDAEGSKTPQGTQLAASNPV